MMVGMAVLVTVCSIDASTMTSIMAAVTYRRSSGGADVGVGSTSSGAVCSRRGDWAAVRSTVCIIGTRRRLAGPTARSNAFVLGAGGAYSYSRTPKHMRHVV